MHVAVMSNETQKNKQQQSSGLQNAYDCLCLEKTLRYYDCHKDLGHSWLHKEMEVWVNHGQSDYKMNANFSLILLLHQLS